MNFVFDLQLFGGGKGGGSSSTTVTTRDPTYEETQLTRQALSYAQAVNPTAKNLNTAASNLLYGKDANGNVVAKNPAGITAQDYTNLLKAAQSQISGATQGMSSLVGSNTSAANTANNLLGNLSPQYRSAANSANSQLASLANGNIPTGYQRNMENAIATALRNTMGNTINNLGQRGVINSSVTNSAMNDIAKNAADTVAQQYQQNINQVGNLTQQQLGNTNTALGAQQGIGQQQLQNTLGANSANGAVYSNLLSSATAPITAAAAAQEAAQQPALNLWNASLGLNGATTGALAAVSGNGTTTSTTTNNGGGGLFSGLLGGLF